MGDRNGVLVESLLRGEPASPHKLSLPNGFTRSVSRRDATISCSPEWIRGEVGQQLAIAGPMVCVSLLQYLVIVVSVMFVGQLGELELASASIAMSCVDVTGYTLIMGFATALETLCGQAYGAKQYRMLGIHIQRAMFVFYLVSVPIAVVFWNVDSVLLLLGQDAEISILAGVYARYLIPTIFAIATLQPLVKFLQTQSLVLPMALFSVATLILHVPLCYTLIYTLKWGFRGAAIAKSISNWLNVLWFALYVRYAPSCARTWTSFSAEALHDVLPFIKLAIPSGLMACLESWSFNILVLLSGLLPNPQVEASAFAICLTTTGVLYMIPYGIGAAVSTRVGNELGAGRPQAAKGAAAVAVSGIVFEGVVIATGLYLGRDLWGKAFTQEPDVIAYVTRIVPLLSFLHVMDALQGVLSGVVRGCGWQALGAAVNLVAYYLVGLPAAIVLAFVYDLKGLGLVLGLIMGVATQAVTLLGLACATNWHQQAEEALVRVYSSVTATLPVEANVAQKEDISALHLFKDGHLVGG